MRTRTRERYQKQQQQHLGGICFELKHKSFPWTILSYKPLTLASGAGD